MTMMGLGWGQEVDCKFLFDFNGKSHTTDDLYFLKDEG